MEQLGIKITRICVNYVSSILRVLCSTFLYDLGKKKEKKRKKKMMYELISFSVRNSHLFYFNEKTHARKAHLFHVEHSFLGSAEKISVYGNTTRPFDKQTNALINGKCAITKKRNRSFSDSRD